MKSKFFIFFIFFKSYLFSEEYNYINYLEKIIEGKNSIEDFLKDKSAIKEYRKILEKYFSGQLNRYSRLSIIPYFRFVLTQLKGRALISPTIPMQLPGLYNNPDLYENLWKIIDIPDEESIPLTENKNFTLIPLRRKFHGLWLRYAVYNNHMSAMKFRQPKLAQPKYFELPTGLWAVAGLENSQIYFINDQNGLYHGYVELIYLSDKNNKVYAHISNSEMNEALLIRILKKIEGKSVKKFVDFISEKKEINNHLSPIASDRNLMLSIINNSPNHHLHFYPWIAEKIYQPQMVNSSKNWSSCQELSKNK